MKKLIPILIILALALFGFYVYKTQEKIETPNEIGSSFRPEMNSGSFEIEGEMVVLSNGRGQITGEDFESEIELISDKAFGDLNGDGKEDSASFLAYTSGGSGIFIYVVGYTSGPVGYKGSQGFFVGDRVAPVSLDIRNGVLFVEYLDRASGEPFSAEPTVSRSLELEYSNGEFVEK